MMRILEEGYVDVKLPPGNPERKLYRAWQKRWMVAYVRFPEGRGEPFLVLHLHRAREDPVLKEMKTSRDGLRLFRCKSKTRPCRTWGLVSGSTVLLYLSAESESRVQQWMTSIRDGLWAPIPGGSHRVSLIDDEQSFAAGLLGVYGNLKRSGPFLILSHPHWGGIQLRCSLSDIINIRILRTIEDDPGAGVFALDLKEIREKTLKRRSLYFYCATAAETVKWLRQNIEGKIDVAIEEASGMNVQDLYAVVAEKHSNHKTKPGLLGLSNISGDFLDTSISSGSAPTIRASEDTDQQDEAFSHLYESIIQEDDHREYSEVVYDERRASAGAHTIYEDIDDAYVPQLPSLPKVSSEARLEKLSENVERILKQIKDLPPKAVGNNQEKGGFSKSASEPELGKLVKKSNFSENGKIGEQSNFEIKHPCTNLNINQITDSEKRFSLI